MGRWRLGFGLVAAAMLLALPGMAQAKPRHAGGYEVRRAGTSGFISLGKKQGYRLAISMPTDKVAVLYAYRFEGKHDSIDVVLSEYAVHNLASLARGVVHARLGSLGRFSLRFQPSGRVREDRVTRGCEGRPRSTEYGMFVGHATFHGEGGYLHFSLRGAKGDIVRSSRLKCEKGRAPEAAPTPRSLRGYVAPRSFFATPSDIALLYASTRSHGRYIGIAAAHQEESPPGADVRVGMFESRGKMAIGRYAVAVGHPGTLLTSLPGEHPATATLAPPAPFYGEATYRESEPASRAWTGTLGVHLPGEKLPLTGPGFQVRLCVLNPLKTRDGCDFFKAEPEFEERAAPLMAR